MEAKCIVLAGKQLVCDKCDQPAVRWIGVSDTLIRIAKGSCLRRCMSSRMHYVVPGLQSPLVEVC